MNLFIVFLGVIGGFALGAICEYFDLIGCHKEYFEKQKERKEWGRR